MRGQAVTLDAVFSLFMVILSFIYLTFLISDTESPEIDRLRLERKSADAVAIVLDARLGSLKKIAEGNNEDLQQINSLLAELKEKQELSGIRLTVGAFKAQAGQSTDYGIARRILVPAYNSTEFIGGEIIVWS